MVRWSSALAMFRLPSNTMWGWVCRRADSRRSDVPAEQNSHACHASTLTTAPSAQVWRSGVSRENDTMTLLVVHLFHQLVLLLRAFWNRFACSSSIRPPVEMGSEVAIRFCCNAVCAFSKSRCCFARKRSSSSNLHTFLA